MLCETHPDMKTHQETDGDARNEERLVLTPRADIHEDATRITLVADLPGVPLKDVSIALERNLLTISGTQAAANHDGYNLSYAEYQPCAFHRAFRVETPIDRDKITASVQNGVLKVVLPKAAPEKVAKIEVAAS